MKILALDPSDNFGWAVSRTIYGVWDLRVRRDESAGMKLLRLKAKLNEIFEKEGIELVVFERPGGRSATALINQAKLQGIVEDFCESNFLEYRGYSPSEIKKFATGKGNANKRDMVKAAKDILGYPGHNDNEADALWLLELAKSDLNL